MAVRSGRYELGPEDATLAVETERAGAAAKAGHDLLIHVKSWRGVLELGEAGAETSVEVEADPTQLRVIEGTGGMQKLGDEDLDNIHQTIDDEVLERKPIEFRSTNAERDGSRVAVEGELAIGDERGPIAFDLEVGDDGALAARAVVTQSEWGIKPYSALFGALKVKDEVVVSLEGRLPDEPRT